MPWIDPAFQMLVATSSLWAPSDQAPGELRDGAHARPIVIGKLAVTSGVAMVKCTPPPAERGTAAREEVDLRVGRRSNVDLDAPPTRLNHGRGIVAGYGDCVAEGSCVRADRQTDSSTEATSGRSLSLCVRPALSITDAPDRVGDSIP